MAGVEENGLQDDISWKLRTFEQHHGHSLTSFRRFPIDHPDKVCDRTERRGEDLKTCCERRLCRSRSLTSRVRCRSWKPRTPVRWQCLGCPEGVGGLDFQILCRILPIIKQATTHTQCCRKGGKMRLFNRVCKHVTSSLWVVVAASSIASAQDLPKTSINYVGTWGSLSLFNKVEKPFWGTALEEASSGVLQVKVQPFTEMGLKGNEILRLLRSGVLEVSATLLS